MLTGLVEIVAGVGFGLLVLVGVPVMLLSRRSTKAQALHAGLYGVVGRMGAGKTYFMTYRGLQALEVGRLVFANYGFEGAERVRTWDEVISAPDGSLILLDEVHLWWPSAEWNVHPELAAWCSQLRKKGITCFWSSQHDSFVSTRLRRLTFGYWEGRRFRSGHRYELFDAHGFHTSTKRVKLATHYVKRSQAVMDAYDTLELVEPVELMKAPKRSNSVVPSTRRTRQRPTVDLAEV